MQHSIFNLISQNGERILPYFGIEVWVDNRGLTHVGTYTPNGKVVELAQYSGYEEAMANIQAITNHIENGTRKNYKFPRDSQLVKRQL